MKDYSIAESLRNIRLEHNLKQKDIAEVLGIDRSTYSFYETGKTNPTIETLCALSRIYNVTIGYLIGKEANNPELREKSISVNAGADPLANLKKDEQLLLMHYRLAEEGSKEKILDMIEDKTKGRTDKLISDN